MYVPGQEYSNAFGVFTENHNFYTLHRKNLLNYFITNE